jgi:hypothetical protein
MEQEREQQRQTYRICRLGFAILSVGLLLASLETLLALSRLFFPHPVLARIVNAPWFQWVGAPIVWGTLVGFYLLWGRWSDPGWQRRAGLLVLMGVVDAVLWLLDHSDDLGLRLSEVGHEWFRHELGMALGWAEFALMAALACEMMAHLGIEQAREAGKATRSLAATGAAVWFLSFVNQTDWTHQNPWPLVHKPIASIEALLLDLGSHMIWAITLIQVTALTFATTKQISRALQEMDIEDQDHDLLKSPSDQEFGLLKPKYGDSPLDSDNPYAAPKADEFGDGGRYGL